MVNGWSGFVNDERCRVDDEDLEVTQVSQGKDELQSGWKLI
ncbi:MAG: hypothetical protein M2R45_04450 [Verrucomicrobia subdivision 3 bacterium]|nr:hypothetical protein [Limisphaerales bacterium]MCS1415018.1 hypothetical protein [Limisphaerales bacterium]